MHSMTKLVVATGVALGLGTSANAADLIIEQPGVIVDNYTVLNTWEGFYVGLSAGWGTGTVDWETTEGITTGDDGSYGISGGLLGAQAGFNAQFDSFVLGVEGDIYWSGISGGMSYEPLPGVDSDITGSVDWLGSLRLRAGVAVTEAVLVYATGGLAAASTSSTVDLSGGVDSSDSSGATHYGYAVGVGAEAMVTEDISIRGQYLYSNFQDADYAYEFGAPAGDVVSSAGFDVHALTVGLNVHF